MLLKRARIREVNKDNKYLIISHRTELISVYCTANGCIFFKFPHECNLRRIVYGNEPVSNSLYCEFGKFRERHLKFTYIPNDFKKM